MHSPLDRRSLITVALLAAAGAACAKVAPNAPAPDFTLRQIDGPNLRLGEQRGRVLRLHRPAVENARRME